MKQKSEASNAQIRKELDISQRTIVRYCDELEKENKIVQVGNTGCEVAYKLKKT